MSFLPIKRANARHNYNEVMEQTYAAIDLLEKDPETRKALKGFATAMTVAETNAGQHSMLHNGRQYIGPYQMNNNHAYAMRNSKEGLALRDRLMEQEALPAKERDSQAQLLLNAGATAGVWTVSRANPYQNQGVLGAVSTIISANAAAKATGKDIKDLDATEVWLPHKLGINGGTAVLKALTENPDTLVSDVESPYGTALSKAAYKNNFKGNYHNATVEDIYDKTHAKFKKKVADRVTNRLTPEQKEFFTAATGLIVPASSPTQVAQATETPANPVRPSAPQPAPNATPPTPPDAAAKPVEPQVASVSTTKTATTKHEPPLKPLANLSTVANDNMRRLSNNLAGMGMIDADMKPEMRAQKLAEYVKENGGMKEALVQSKIVITQIQTELQASGVLKASADGLYGKETRAAHLAYRSAHNKDPQTIATQTAQKTDVPLNNPPKIILEPASQANLPPPSQTPVIKVANNGRGAQV